MTERCTATTAADTRCRRNGRWQVDGSTLPLCCYQHAAAYAHHLNLPRIVDLLSGRIRTTEDLPQPRSLR